MIWRMASGLVTAAMLAACTPAAEVAEDTGPRSPQMRRITVDGRSYLAEWKVNYETLESEPDVIAEVVIPTVTLSRGNGTQFADTAADRAEAAKVAHAFCDQLGFKLYTDDVAGEPHYNKFRPRIERPAATGSHPDQSEGNNAEWFFPGICAPEDGV